LFHCIGPAVVKLSSLICDCVGTCAEGADSTNEQSAYRHGARCDWCIEDGTSLPTAGPDCKLSHSNRCGKSCL